MYRTFHQELQEIFNRKVYKLSVSGGVTCPNRDGTLGTRGCIFCNGSGDFAPNTGSITEQLNRAKEILGKKGEGCAFLPYFQSFTNTYAPVEKLRAMYEEALSFPDAVGLSIATRPDCLPENVLALLSEMAERAHIWVELGLQTVHPQTADYIRRGYKLEVYDRAVEQLHRIGCRVVTHMIVGLPGENAEMMEETARHIGDVGSDGIKIQLLHILKNTDLEKEYLAGRVPMLSLEEYTEIAARLLTVLPSKMTVHRITGDGAKRNLVAPLWSGDKHRVLNTMHRYFAEKQIQQGSRSGQNGKTTLYYTGENES